MLVLVTFLGDALVMVKYKKMVVFGFVLCWQRQRKRRAVDGVGYLCLR